MELTNLSIEEIMEIPFLSYHKPLDAARRLGRSSGAGDRDKAIDLLRALVGRYPHVLAIGQELVIVLMEAARHDEAEVLLRRFEKEFRNLDEEFLCRWGRLFKDRGDEHAALPWSMNEGRRNADLAAKHYRMSLEKYDRAYQIRSGHYPGINKATLLLILGSLVPQAPGSPGATDLQESADLAGTLLDRRRSWPREGPDDEAVWHPATAGEAHLLRQEWDQAAGQYREAIRHKSLTAHSRNAMRRQAERIVACFRGLGVVPAAPFDDPTSFFSPAPETPAPVEAGPTALATA